MGTIQGVGVDLVDVKRMEGIIAEQGERFLNRVFTERERLYCEGKPNPAQHFAARFAAKEAVSKALQTGWSGTFRWKDVEVVNRETGAPQVLLSNEMAAALANSRIHLSLSHTEHTVVAFALIEAV
jgi:holo-[acyl-carrier protein] synthase